MDLAENLPDSVAIFPLGKIRLEFMDVTDPPNVVANAVVFNVTPVELPSADFLADLDRFQHGTIGMPAASDIVDLPEVRGLKELPKRFDKIVTMNIVAHCLPL